MASNLPTDPVPDSNAALWLAVGRLQSDTTRLIEGSSRNSDGHGRDESSDNRDQRRDEPQNR